MPQSLINVINLPKGYFSQSKIAHLPILTVKHLENKLAEDRGNPPEEDEYCDFMNLFGQCLANVWPFACKSLQTASDGVVCFAKCKPAVFNWLNINVFAVLQRRGILSRNFNVNT